METKIPELRRELLELVHLGSAISLLSWDKSVNMPNDHRGHDIRNQTLATLEEMAHRRFTSAAFAVRLHNAEALLKKGSLNEDDRIIVEHIQRDFDRAKKLPSEFIAQSEKLFGESYTVWVEAREKSNFQMFAPNLKKIVETKRKEAELIGFTGSPYDVLLDDYEIGLTTQKLDKTFSELKAFLIPFLVKIMEHRNDYRFRIPNLRLKISIPRQEAFIKTVVSRLGYNFDCGHLGTSIHPFSLGLHPTDARITIRYDERRMLDEALYSAIHEAGHAMYEQNLPTKHWGTPLGESVSLGIHESQSRFWENIVGRSEAFWRHFQPLIISLFPEFIGYNSVDFYRALNNVNPSFIRVDADEVTYNLHIILRYEIEKDMIEGKMEVDDVPMAWNQKVKEYLGIDVTDDRHGVLQDVHWSGGSFGYFPTYTLGNMYSAQIYEAIQNKMCFHRKIEEGDFKAIFKWLRKHIYRYGSRYSPEELIRRATGKLPDTRCFNRYLLQKYSDIYNL